MHLARFLLSLVGLALFGRGDYAMATVTEFDYLDDDASQQYQLGSEGLYAQQLQLSWKDMVKSITQVTKHFHQQYNAELDLLLDRANATMQAWHARNLVNFEQLKNLTATQQLAWQVEFDKQAELFRARMRGLNRALQLQGEGPALLPPAQRFTVLHHTDSLRLHRLYRIMRAREQLEALGHRYVVLYHRSAPSASTAAAANASFTSPPDAAEAQLATLRALLPNLSVFVSEACAGRRAQAQAGACWDDAGSYSSYDAVSLVSEWFRGDSAAPSNATAAGGGNGGEEASSSSSSSSSSPSSWSSSSAPAPEADSGLFWVLSLDVEWVGSLPHVLMQLGRDRSSRGPVGVLSLGCVDNEEEEGRERGVAEGAEGADGAASVRHSGRGAGKGAGRGAASGVVRLWRRFSPARLVAKAAKALRLLFSWLSGWLQRLRGRQGERPKHICGGGVWAVSRAVLERGGGGGGGGDLNGTGTGTAVARLFNAVLSADTASEARDATRYGLGSSLLHSDFGRTLHSDAPCGACGHCWADPIQAASGPGPGPGPGAGGAGAAASSTGCGGDNPEEVAARRSFAATKESYRKQQAGYRYNKGGLFVPGVLFRCADACDYELHV